jgi:DNA polymerase-4
VLDNCTLAPVRVHGTPKAEAEQRARDLLDQLWAPPTRVRLVGVGVSGFDDVFDQLSLFEDADETEEKATPQRDLRQLSEVTDRLRERFGTDAVKWGRDLRLGDAARHHD